MHPSTGCPSSALSAASVSTPPDLGAAPPFPTDRRRCRVGSPPRAGGAAALLLGPPPPAPAAAAARPADKGRPANFLWHMLLRPASLQLLSGFVSFRTARAPVLSQRSPSTPCLASGRVRVLSL